MNWTLIICLLIIAGVILTLSGRRLNPGRFFQAIVSPAWNNKVLLGLAAAVIIILGANVYNGGGKPLGLTAMQKVVSQPTPKTDMERFYTDSAQYFVTGSEKPSTAKPDEPAKSTWNGWLVLIGLTIATIVFIPFAFWDEVRDSWRWAMEQAEQRRVVIDLRPPAVEQAPPPAPGQAPGPINRPAQTTWGQRFKEQFVAVLSASTLIEFGEELIRRILTDRIVRRRL